MVELTPINELEKQNDERQAVLTACDDAITQIQEKVQAGNADISDATKDIADMVITAKAFNESDEKNKPFLEKSTKTKQKEYESIFEAKKIEAKKNEIETKNKKAEAVYKHWRPILEFDFSHLIEYESTKKQSTYTDRAYGIPLMTLMLIVLTLPYIAVTLLLATFNSINAVFTAISKFGKIAQKVSLSIFIIGILLLVAYIIILLIQSFFGIKIIP